MFELLSRTLIKTKKREQLGLNDNIFIDDSKRSLNSHSYNITALTKSNPLCGSNAKVVTKHGIIKSKWKNSKC